MIKIEKNKDLLEHVKEYDIILLGADYRNNCGNGFFKKICINFPEVAKFHKDGKYMDPKRLGNVTVVNSSPIFCICYITKGRLRPDIKPDTVEYDKLEECLSLISQNFQGKRIASTILGNSPFEGGGNKDRILEIFQKYCGDLDITLYDYEQIDFYAENAEKWHNIIDQIGKISKDEYYDIKKRFLWEETFGIYTPVPDIPESEIKKIIKEYKKNK